MIRKIPTTTLNWVIMITLAILLVELLTFGGGFLFTALFLGFLIFLGWKNYHSLFGKVLFWVGIVSLVLNVLNMYAVRFLVIALIILFFLQYRKSKHEPEYIKPRFDANAGPETETLTEIKPLLQHRFYGEQKTEDVPYQWRDVNIHGGFGDRIIDLSNTVIQEDAIISIRHFMGSIKIYVPYEVEVSVQHSCMFGHLSVFQSHERKLFNQSVAFQTKNYQQGKPRVKIVTSIFSGDIEVRRI